MPAAFARLSLPLCLPPLMAVYAAAGEATPSLPAAANRPIDFVNDVRPILASRCYSCHGPQKQRSSYRLDVKKIALTGGDIGGPIVPGKSAQSPLIEEIACFVADDSPDAYENLVDRLLASPHYGERWARHWMDVVHFAETHGNDQDRPRPHAWPYRDYLSRSFNRDKPYARFVEEQAAGDVLCTDDPQAIVATGCIAAGPWDESSMRDIQDNMIDKAIAQNLDRNDMVTTTLATFASTTIHCARCHNHKFDPISQAEYYSLQAVFAGVDRANRPYDADPAIHRRRQALLGQKTKLAAGIEAVGTTALLDAKLQADVAEWEQARAAESASRTWRSFSAKRKSALPAARN